MGAFLLNMQQEGHPHFGRLSLQYNAMFVDRKTSQVSYTGLGALFPDPDGAQAKQKFACLSYKTQGAPLDSYNRFVWSVVSRGQGQQPSGNANSCSAAATSVIGGGVGLGEVLLLIVVEVIKALLDRPNRAIGVETIGALMQPPPTALLAATLIPWLSTVTVEPSGQLQLLGISSGALTNLKLYYGTRQADATILVMGMTKPSFRYPRTMMAKAGLLKKAPWRKQPSDECGGGKPTDQQRCAIFTDWLGPVELFQELRRDDGSLETRTALVTVQEEHQDALETKDAPETVTIPVRYFEMPGCSVEKEGTALNGLLQGNLRPPHDNDTSLIKLEGWTLVVYRHTKNTVEAQTVSMKRGSGGGSFQAAQLVFDMARANDPQYHMGAALPVPENNEGTPPTCFEYSCKNSSAFKPSDCPEIDGELSEPTLSLRVYPHPELPIVTLLRGYSVDGAITSRALTVAPTEHMKMYGSGRWPFVAFPKCEYLDDRTCGHLCACWSRCRFLQPGGCDTHALQRGYHFQERTTWDPSTWSKMSTSKLGRGDGCAIGRNRNLCIAERGSN